MELNTIQKNNKLNLVEVNGDKGPGGAYHDYSIYLQDNPFEYTVLVPFQKGSRKDITARQGVLDVDLLEIVRHRLQCFQEGEFACRENEMALSHIEALLWMNKRIEDRAERNVLGTNQK